MSHANNFIGTTDKKNISRQWTSDFRQTRATTGQSIRITEPSASNLQQWCYKWVKAVHEDP